MFRKCQNVILIYELTVVSTVATATATAID